MPNTNTAIVPGTSTTVSVTTPAVGDILVSSWGYDQTNIDFYQVVAVTKSSVKVREISKVAVGGSMSTVEQMPVPGSFVGETMTKRFRAYGPNRYQVRIHDSASAWTWSGSPMSETRGGFGH